MPLDGGVSDSLVGHWRRRANEFVPTKARDLSSAGHDRRSFFRKSVTTEVLEPLTKPPIVPVRARGRLPRFVRASWSRSQNHRLFTSMPVGDSRVLSGLLSLCERII